jgi:hypothetical protein
MHAYGAQDTLPVSLQTRKAVAMQRYEAWMSCVFARAASTRLGYP